MIVYRFKLDDDQFIEVESHRPINIKAFYESSEADRKELEWVPTEDALTAEAAIERLNDKYDLVYVDYDDKLTDEQVEALVSGDIEKLWELLGEFEMDSRDYGSKAVIDNEFSTEEWESLSIEAQDEVRSAIEERDDSDWVMDLISHTSDPLLRINVVDEDNCWSYQQVEPQEVLTAIGLEATEHNVKVVQYALDNASPEFSTLLAYWIVTLPLESLYKADDGDEFRITNPHLYLGNPFAGSGWVTDEALEGTVTVKREDVHTDKAAFGYSVSEVYGGLSASQYEAQVEIIKAEVNTDGE